MVRVNLRGTNRGKKKLADGTVREHHYLGRGKGAIKFWDSASAIPLGSPDYTSAFSQAASSQSPAQGKFQSVILSFLSSQNFSGPAPRTQSDLRKLFYHAVDGIDAKFGNAPLAAFDHPRIRRQALDVREEIETFQKEAPAHVWCILAMGAGPACTRAI